MQHLAEQQAYRRGVRRRLENEAVARGERERQLFHREDQRIVEREYSQNNAERVADGHRHVPRLARRVYLRCVAAAFARRDAEEIHAAGKFTARDGLRLAALADEKLQKFFRAALHNVRGAQQHALAHVRQRPGPAGKRGRGSRKRGLHVGRTGAVHREEGLARCRLHILAHTAVGLRRPCAVQIQRILVSHWITPILYFQNQVTTPRMNGGRTGALSEKV